MYSDRLPHAFGLFPWTDLVCLQQLPWLNGENTASVDGSELLNTPSVDGIWSAAAAVGTEWQNTPSVDGICSVAAVDGSALLVAVGSETRVEFCVFCSMDTFSVTKHFLENTHHECSFSGQDIWCICTHDFYLNSVLVSFPSKKASERANWFD